MGELILCSKPIAATPYYMEELSLNIYSLEEMSYYIFNNVYLLGADFMSVDLCNWIGRDLGMPELKTELMGLMRENVPLHIFVGKLLSATGYLTRSEIRDTLDIISVFENKSEAECKKIRADRLMEKRRIVDAIYEYESLISGSDNIADRLLGDIWHNLGTAYARLFFFEEACECFRRAYTKNNRRQSMKSALFSALCLEEMRPDLESRFDAMVLRFELSPDEADKIRTEMVHIRESDEITSFRERLDHLRSDYSEQSAYLKQIENIINGYKRDYIKLCRI